MRRQNPKITTFALCGLCALSLIMAYNAGWKRRGAVSNLNTLQAKIDELDLRYKNAITSYDLLEKKFKTTQKDLQDQILFGESIKEVLAQEQQKSAGLRKQIEELNSRLEQEDTEPRRSRQRR